MLPNHRILSESAGLPLPDPMEIAIHYRPDASDLTRQVATMLAQLVED